MHVFMKINRKRNESMCSRDLSLTPAVKEYELELSPVHALDQMKKCAMILGNMRMIALKKKLQENMK